MPDCSLSLMMTFTLLNSAQGATDTDSQRSETLFSSTCQPCNSNLLCVIISQVPSHPVHREPLQCPSAEEDGPVPDWDLGRQTGPVQHQSRWVWTAAVARNAQGQNPRQGKVRVGCLKSDWFSAVRGVSPQAIISAHSFIIWRLNITVHTSKAGHSGLIEVILLESVWVGCVWEKKITNTPDFWKECKAEVVYGLCVVTPDCRLDRYLVTLICVIIEKQ